jgi:hypothetical protein
MRVWDISAVIAGTGPPVVTAVWDLNDLPLGPHGTNAKGLISVRYTGKASGLLRRRGGAWALRGLAEGCGPGWVWGPDVSGA